MSDPSHSDVPSSQTVGPYGVYLGFLQDRYGPLKHERDLLYDILRGYRDNQVLHTSTLGDTLNRLDLQERLVDDNARGIYDMLRKYHADQSRHALALDEALSVFEQDSPVESNDSLTSFEQDSSVKTDDSLTHVVLPELPTPRSQYRPVEQDDSPSLNEISDPIEYENALEQHSRLTSESVGPFEPISTVKPVVSMKILGPAMFSDILPRVKENVDRTAELYNAGCGPALDVMHQVHNILYNAVPELERLS